MYGDGENIGKTSNSPIAVPSEIPQEEVLAMRTPKAQSIWVVFQVHYSGNQDDLQGFRQYVGDYFPENSLWDLRIFLSAINILLQYIRHEYIAVYVCRSMGKKWKKLLIP